MLRLRCVCQCLLDHGTHQDLACCTWLPKLSTALVPAAAAAAAAAAATHPA
jgi:hypothetical protein